MFFASFPQDRGYDMHLLIKSAVIAALMVLTQAASSEWTGQFDRYSNMDTQASRVVRPDPQDPRTRLHWYSAGEARTRKIVDNEFTFRPRLRRPADRIRLAGTKSGVIIRSVIVEFRNGSSLDLRPLEGRLREGQVIAARLNRQFISEIKVVATTESLVGSRGQFRVDIGIYE